MRLGHTGKPDNYYYYVLEDVRDDSGKRKTRTVESLGCASVIREKYNVTDAEAWCRDYIAQKNKELTDLKKVTEREIVIKLREHKPKPVDSHIFNVGYLILEKLYYSFGIAHICDEIMKANPQIKGFDLNAVLKTILYGRILALSSNSFLTNKLQHKLLEKLEFDVQHIDQAIALLNEHAELFQKGLAQYISNECELNANHLYYFVTNFYCENEMKDYDQENKSEILPNEHTVRNVAKSKKNSSNSIVQMGLFMDGNGIPLGFCITPRNVNEQNTMVPLEKKLIKNFEKSDFIVCSDSMLLGEEDLKYNSIDESTSLVKLGLIGERRFICTQVLNNIKAYLREWLLDPKGWSYTKIDKDGNEHVIKNFDLTELNDHSLYSEYYQSVFYKERTLTEDLDARLIVTFSLKYRDYIESKIKPINNGLYAHESDRVLRPSHCTETGEFAEKEVSSLNTSIIYNDEKYDGFYAVITNIPTNEMSTDQIATVASRNREIEETFSIMKADLNVIPFYHNKDQRIIAHFLIYFISFLLLQGIEHKIENIHDHKIRYPDGRYTMIEIIDALKSLQVISVDDGQGYQPDYNNSDLISDLLACFDLKEFDREVIMRDTMKKILKRIKEQPKRLKIQKS